MEGEITYAYVAGVSVGGWSAGCCHCSGFQCWLQYWVPRVCLPLSYCKEVGLYMRCCIGLNARQSCEGWDELVVHVVADLLVTSVNPWSWWRA